MQIEVAQQIAAPRERVFDVYSDFLGWPRWAGVKEVVLRQQGDPPPSGLARSGWSARAGWRSRRRSPPGSGPRA